MATNDGNIEDLSDDEIEARQRAEDGEDANTDPKAGDEVKDEANADDAKAQADAAEATAKVDDDEAAKAAATAAAEAAAATAAGADAAKELVKVDGVLSKDGGRVLPYGALQASRRDTRRAESRAERAERELAEVRQQLEDAKAGKTKDGDELTEAKVADMEANFPEEGKKLRAAFNRIQELEAKVPKADTPKDEPTDDPVQEAIDQVPLLLDWQHGDPDKFARAVEHDAVLVKSPKWAGKPAVERFAEATRRTADEYDIEFPEPKAKASTTAAAPAATPTPAAKELARKNPETLSDFKGGSLPDHGTVDIQRMAPTTLLNKMNDMTDDEIDAHLAKYG